MRPIRDDSGERNGWWIGERFVPEDGSDLTRRDAEIAALREAIRNLAAEIDRHDIRAQISTTMIHWFKRLAIDAIAWQAADEVDP